MDYSREREEFFWTLQQFTNVCDKPWLALQQQNDGRVIRQFTGYRHEMDELCRKYGIIPEELAPTTEEEFIRRAMGEMPEETTIPRTDR